MTILVAEDDPVTRRLLENALAGWGHVVASVADGRAAWEALQREGAPRLAVLDWMMPGLDGLQVCRMVRESAVGERVYLLLVTSRDAPEDIVAGLDAGANDYITKPFVPEELRARVQVGVRFVELQQSLERRVQELQDALGHVRQLQGILPVCCYCKKVRDDAQFWQRVEDYLGAHPGVELSHGICPDCWESVVQPQMVEMWGHSIPYEEER